MHIDISHYQLGGLCSIILNIYKDVSFFRKIGAKVKKEVTEHFDKKAESLKTKDFKKKMLAAVTGTAFAWAIGGPLGGLGALGAAGIHIVVVDP